MLIRIYHSLFNAYGRQGWWPLSKKGLHSRHHNGRPENEKDRFEIIVGAILTQNTSWKNVEKALYQLNANKLLTSGKIAAVSHGRLAKCIRSSGYHNQKAGRLKIIAKYVKAHPKLLDKPIAELRCELLAIKGIGPETADSIVLYAAEKPSFVIDAYTKRIFSRIGICRKDAEYDELRKLFMDSLQPDTEMFKEYHALIVQHAKQHCRTKPLCEGCPLSKCCRKLLQAL